LTSFQEQAIAGIILPPIIEMVGDPTGVKAASWPAHLCGRLSTLKLKTSIFFIGIQKIDQFRDARSRQWSSFTHQRPSRR
jgi:hypothetical protein